MKDSYIAFSYNYSKSPLHKVPAIYKLFLIPILSIIAFKTPVQFSIVLIFIFFTGIKLFKFSIKQSLIDSKPVIYYIFLLYFTNFIAALFSNLNNKQPELLKNSIIQTVTNPEPFYLLLKLLVVILYSSLLFKTSTTLEIRKAIIIIEGTIRKFLPVSKEAKFSNTLTLFICFIPTVYKTWEQCKKAWKARQGKNNFKMYLTIFPVFFSVGIKQAWNTTKAILARA